MYCLLKKRWVDSALDTYRRPDQYRVRVAAMANLEKPTGIYFIRPFSARLIWNYVSEVGLIGVWRKVASRYQERFRNEKYVSFGFGEIVEAAAAGDIELGEFVVFLAPNTPACVERLVLSRPFLQRCEAREPSALSPHAILHIPLRDEHSLEGEWLDIARSWDDYSGRVLTQRDRERLEAGMMEVEQKLDWSSARRLPVDAASPISETRRRETPPTDAKRKTAVLFGYGHYAKTNILPNVRNWISIEAVHEIDPIEIPRGWAGVRYWDTAPAPRENERYDVYLIAGYHHSHAPLAIEALRCGAYAVVEKPLAVDRRQFDELLSALEVDGAGYFGCFHRRYSPLNDMALYDLGQRPGDPIDYHCIVFEVRLPPLHWYRWPNSKSRLVSNGCHWVDHFLYLNGFSEVESARFDESSTGALNCSITLRNGAYFTMVLTDKGSERIGLQDHVELRAGEVTVRIIDGSRYFAEDSTRVLRRARINKIASYRVMYRTIAKRIATDEGGDTLQSVRVSMEAVLRLQEMLEAGR